MEREPIRMTFLGGIPIEQADPDRVLEHEATLKKWIDENTVEFPDGKDFLRRQIDFDKIRSLIEEDYQKIGYSAKEINLIDFDRIYFSNNQTILPEAWAGYFPDANIIIISKQFTEEVMSELKPAAFIAFFETLVLKVLIHEEIHAISGSMVSVRDHRNYELISGLKSKSFAPDFKEEVNGLLDEGVTELWARELSVKYLKRDGFTGLGDLFELLEKKSDVSLESAKDTVTLGGNNYAIAVYLIRRLLERISLVCGVSKEVVWGSFKRAKVQNKEFDFDRFLLWLENDEDTKKFFPSGTAMKLARDSLEEVLAEWKTVDKDK